jgi:hypothetical protein
VVSTLLLRDADVDHVLQQPYNVLEGPTECPFAVPERPIGGIFESIECERVRMVALGAVEAVPTGNGSGEAFLTVTVDARREFG